MVFNVLLCFLLTLIIGCGQLYFLIRIISDYNITGYHNYIFVVITALFFFVFAIVFVFRSFLTILFAFMEGSKVVEPLKVSIDDMPNVCILIPCYNEEENIIPTINSALNVTYNNKEIIIIDDGSTDRTYDVANEYINKNSLNVKIIRQKNGGKASALNNGFSLTKCDYILSMDADSELEKDSLLILVNKIVSEDVAAVAGQVVIKNTCNMVTYLQQLEYIIMNGAPRLLQSFFKNVLITPGPITLFNRNSLASLHEFEQLSSAKQLLGPWDTSTFAEDAKLSMSLLTFGESCVYVPDAICYTQSPTTIPALMNQRYRWIRGNLQALNSSWNLWRKYSKNNPSLGFWLSLFYFDSVVWPIIDLLGLFLILFILSTSGTGVEGLFWLAFLIFTDISTFLFSAKSCGARKSMLIFMPLYRFGYGLILQCITIFAALDEIRKVKMNWS